MCRKRPYQTRYEARKGARFAKGRYKRVLFIYKCRICKTYHLTSQPQKRGDIINKYRNGD